MKNILFSLLLFVYSVATFGQANMPYVPVSKYFDNASQSDIGSHRNGDLIYGLVDDNTGENVSYSKVTSYINGAPMSDNYVDGVIYCKKGGEYFKRNFTGNIMPGWFGVDNTGKKTNTQATLNKWLDACKAFGGVVYMPAGKYIFPVDFQYDFGKGDFSLIGEGEGKTIITTYDGTPATNIAIPEKIDISQANRHKDGIYQIDITGRTIHTDFSGLTDKDLDSYIEIKNGIPTSLTGNGGLKRIKSLGYITELSTCDPNDVTKDSPTEPADIPDGLYVVAKHGNFVSGGAYQHNTLPWAGHPKFLQGTVLRRSGGIWSNFYTGAGFVCQGNYRVSNVSFDNVQFYPFSPVSLNKERAPEADIFEIKNCSFKNCVRVLCLMSAFTNHAPEYDKWFQYFEYFDADECAYENFSIRDCDFSYIHTSVAWALPPAKNYFFTGNYVHDCYTIITVFHNSPYRQHRDVFDVNTTITNNTFLRIRPLNIMADGYFSIVRTFGTAVINNNVFDDIATLRPIYVCSNNVLIEGNFIKMFPFDYGNIKPIITAPLLLSKYTWANGSITRTHTSKTVLGNSGGEIKIANNTIIASTYSLFGCEGTPSVTFDNNTVYLYAANRYITSESALLDAKKVYKVLDLPTFENLAEDGGYETDIAANDYVYYNARKGKWCKFSNRINMTSIYSKRDKVPINPPNYIRIINNVIEADGLTIINSGAPQPGNIMPNIYVNNNQLYYTRYLHSGGGSIVDDYNVSNNTFQYAGINYRGLSPGNTLINNLIVKNNVFEKSIDNNFQLAVAKSADVENNIFTYTPEQHDETVLKDFAASSMASDAANTDVLEITGAPGSDITIKNNRFDAGLSNGKILTIYQPDKLDIANNSFNLSMQPWETKSANRMAINIVTKTATPSVEITDNELNFGTSKAAANDFIDFDNSPGKISSLLIDNNRLSNSSAPVGNTIQAPTKTIVNFIKGKNTLSGAEKIGTINNTENR